LEFFGSSIFVASATFVGAVTALMMTAFMWSRRRAPGAAYVAWLMIAAATWSIGYGFEVVVNDLDEKLRLIPIEYVGISTVPVFWFLTAAQLTGRIRQVKPQYVALVLIIPVITVVLTSTNSSHHLMWNKVELVGASEGISIVFERGTWFWVGWVYSYAMFFGSFGLLLYRAFTEVSMFRSQMVTTMAAGVIPLIANLVFLTDLNPLGVFDPTPMSFTASSVIVAFGFIRFKLFDLVPVAVDVLVAQIPEAMFVIDPAGQIVEINPAAHKLLTRPDEHPVGTHICDAVVGVQEDHYLCQLAPPESAEALELEVEKDGTVAIYSVTVNQLQESHGPSGRMVIMRDITAEREAADTLRRLARITTLNSITTSISAAHDIESVMRTAVEQTGTLLPADFAAGMVTDVLTGELQILHTFGEPQKEFEHGSIAQKSLILGDLQQTRLFNLEDDDTAQDSLTHSLADGGLKTVMTQPISSGGEAYGMLLIARTTPESLGDAEIELLNAIGGHTAQAIYGARLVDDLRSTNEQLVLTRQQAMRQERLRALGQMASGITHDINNALSPVIGFSDMLLQESSELSEDSRKLLQLIRLAALDISRIVERMRQMYRDREAAVAEVGVVDLRQIVKETIELTRPTWQDHPEGEIRITTDFGRAIPPISGIDTEIREALTNLVLNAVDAMPSGGNIEIALSSDPDTEAESAPDPTQVTIAVKDAGSGMSPEIASRAIEPFFTTKGDAGTGLGLPMVQQVMERHQGKLKISQNSPVGTVVELTFPIKNERVVTTRAAEDDSATAQSLKVLVVDDEPMLRMVVEEMLSAEGHSAMSADGGPEASELILEHMNNGEPFNVVITDIEMPKLNGRMLADFVENNSPDTDVIFMTGYADNRIDLDSISTRVIGIVHKPPRLADINALLSVAAMNFSPPE